MKAMSFNIWVNRDTWPDRRSGIVNKIIEMNPDIIGLQEVGRLQLPDLIDDLADSYDMIEFDISPRYDNPIMLKKNRFTILNQNFVDASSCGAFTRTVNWLLLQDNESGKEFYFYNNHFCTPGTPQEEHAIVLAETIEQHQVESGSNDRAAIAVGDLNSNRNSAVMQYLLDQIPLNGVSNPVSLVDTWEVVFSGIPKPPTTIRTASIDWILTLTGVSVTDAFVGDSEGFSDHHPLTATFDL